MKLQELKCLCYSTFPVGNGSHHEASKIYFLLWPTSCCHVRKQDRMSHFRGRTAVFLPGWYKWDRKYSISSDQFSTYFSRDHYLIQWIWLVGHVIIADHACLSLWGLEAVSWVDSRPIVSGSCAQQGQGEMTLVWQWYGSVQCEKVRVQGYYWMAPNTNCTMKLTRLWYTWHSVCPRMCLWETLTCHTQHDYSSNLQ